jgi:hypothetical protein
MPKINLPPGCNGFADGDRKYIADKPGGSVYLDPDRDANALRKLKNQDYASAGLVDAGPEKQFIKDNKKQGRWCQACHRLWQPWSNTCVKCGEGTIPESEMEVAPMPRDIHGAIIP